MEESQLRPQPWQWPGPRVLLEQAYGPETNARVNALRRAGYAVAVCPGPAPHEHCPLASESECVAATGADVVVSSLGFETDAAREALAALRGRLPRTRVLIEADAAAAAAWPELVEGWELVAGPLTPEELVARVGAALDREAGGLA